ncbi:aspartyl protease family protein At5g10770-like [Oryza brachyantha]|uniref:aspartyl protease family protein At5g10770-like n=1 Tax=Oryza brachyantha TaxID=4533 RepID=UPI000776509C|nr:aspartyl protease family protein At5g10770-like [Oryza brachyantha]
MAGTSTVSPGLSFSVVSLLFKSKRKPEKLYVLHSAKTFRVEYLAKLLFIVFYLQPVVSLSVFAGSRLTSRSSSFAAVPCGSPECPMDCTGSNCPFTVPFGNTTVANCTLVRDTLALSPSATFAGFTFGCVEFGAAAKTFDAAIGLIDLSRSSHLLASRVISSPPAANGTTTAAFSYCLPSSTSSRDFLSVRAVVEQPQPPKLLLRRRLAVVGISVAGTQLPVPPTVFTAASTMLEVATEFTFLAPAAYAALRDEFRKAMAQYAAAPPFQVLDTCRRATTSPGSTASPCRPSRSSSAEG